MMAGFRLGKGSLKELAGVEPALVKIVKLAITLTKQDFTVYDGVRSLAEQHEMVRKKASKTMKSRHLVQANGFGRAVDLPAWINEQARWEWGAAYEIAAAMKKAAKQLGLDLVWGGVWDKPMSAYPGTTAAAMKKAVAEYSVRHPGPDFLDGPHFELVK